MLILLLTAQHLDAHVRETEACENSNTSCAQCNECKQSKGGGKQYKPSQFRLEEK